MELHGTTIAHSLNLKTTDSFHAVEVFRVGMNTIKLPTIFSIRFSGNQLDTDLKTFRSDEADIEGYDVWEGNDDAIKCASCQSPEAIDRSVKTLRRYEHELKQWVEIGDEVTPLCSNCACAKFISGSGGYVGVTMPPPSGYIIQYPKSNETRSRSAGRVRNPGITRKFTRYLTSPAGPVEHVRNAVGTVSKGKVSVTNRGEMNEHGKHNRCTFYDNKQVRHLESVRYTPSRVQARAAEAEPKVEAPVTFRYTSTYMSMATDKVLAGLMTDDQYDFIMNDLITRI